MSGHSQLDMIPYLRAMLEADERHSFTAALDALLAENQRYEKALERITKPNDHELYMSASEIAREALAGDTG